MKTWCLRMMMVTLLMLVGGVASAVVVCEKVPATPPSVYAEICTDPSYFQNTQNTTCVDTDPNNDPAIMGVIDITSSDGKPLFSMTDQCGGTIQSVNQISCATNKATASWRHDIYKCPEGTSCTDGACKAPVFAGFAKICVGIECIYKYLDLIQTPNTWYYWREGKVYTEHGCTTDFTEKDAAGNPIPWRATKTIGVYFEGNEYGTNKVYESSGKCKNDVPWFFAQKNGKLNGIDNGFAMPGNLIGALYGSTIYTDTQKWCPTKLAPVYISGKNLGTEWAYCSPEEVQYYAEPDTVVTWTMPSFFDFANYDLAKCDSDKNGFINEAVKDPNLLKAIQNKLGVTKITVVKAMELGMLWAKNSGISSLEGIQCFPNVGNLNFEGNEIVDLTPLAGKKIGMLYLDKNKISDITPLEDLTELEQLSVENNKISNLGSMKNLQKLNTFFASSNEIKDITPLAPLTQLQHLWLRNQPISNVGSLSALVNLKELDISGTGFSDLTPLTNLTKLEILFAPFNPITDISPLLSIGSSKLNVTLPSDTNIPPAQIQKLKATGANVDFAPNW